MGEKKVVGRNVAIALGIVSIILVAGLVGAVVNYNNTIASLTSETTTKDNTIASLNSQLATLNSQLTNLNTTKVVNLAIMADWGGAGYDAFIVSKFINGTLPKPATNVAPPGSNNNNITLRTGVPVTFVITNLDTATFDFSTTVTVPFAVYNGTESGQTALQYTTGEHVNMIASHTFTITSLNINIPTPPDTITVFTYTFTKAGIYTYFCATPCGPGMSVPGYMIGYVIVT